MKLDYTYSAGQSATRFLQAMAEGKLVGQRCPVDGKVYLPSRGSCSQHGVPLTSDRPAWLREPLHDERN